MNKRTCSIDGCVKPHRARGLCASHYNQTHCKDRHAPKPTNCTVCGKSIMRAHKSNRRPTCSPQCRHALSQQDYTRTSDYNTWAMERARRAGATIVEDINNLTVFERDKWTCYICNEPVNKDADCYDPRSATVDHIIPLSAGGQHTMDNVKLACLHCNSAKQNRTHHSPDPQGEGPKSPSQLHRR